MQEHKRIIAFGGGTGLREISRALIKRTCNITRVVPVFDNGGSSKILREIFSVLPIGDIRNALITMASHKGEIRKIVKLFNWRLPSKGVASSIISNELLEIIEGKHNLIREIDPNLKGVIKGYLNRFRDELPNNFEMKLLKNGSIGNFILLGAYFAHNRDINAAIYVFRQLCQIKGNVLPVSLENNFHLGAVLNNKERKIFWGQKDITSINRDKWKDPIDDIFLTENITSKPESHRQIEIDANPLVIEEIGKADLIVYGPGSFYTSLMPHFMIRGIVNTIADSEAPKVLIANLTESNETYHQSLDILLKKLFKMISSYTNCHHRSLKSYITHILINRNVGRHFVYGTNRKYLQTGDLSKFKDKDKIGIKEADVEDPWNRGFHDAEIISDMLIDYTKI